MSMQSIDISKVSLYKIMGKSVHTLIFHFPVFLKLLRQLLEHKELSQSADLVFLIRQVHLIYFIDLCTVHNGIVNRFLNNLLRTSWKEATGV